MESSTDTNLKAFPYYLPEIDQQILLCLSDRELSAICSVNKYVMKICQDNRFWRLKVSKSVGGELIDNINYKDAYSKYVDYRSEVRIDPTFNPQDPYLDIEIKMEISNEDLWYRLAAKHGYLEIIKLLSMTVSNYTVDLSFTWAAAFNQLAVIKYIESEGKRVRYKLVGHLYDFDEWRSYYEDTKRIDMIDEEYFYLPSPMSWAASAGNLDIIEFFYSLPNPLDNAYENENILGDAAYGGRINIVKYLIKKGIDRRYYDKALYYAALEGHINIVDLLISHGANLHRRLFFPLLNIVQKYLRSKFRKHEIYGEILLSLIKNGENWRHYYEDLIYSDYIPLVDYLLRIDGVNEELLKKLAMNAASNRLPHKIIYLIRRAEEYDISIDVFKNSLSIAYIHDYVDIINILIDNGVTLDE